MISISLGAEDLSRIRFAVSPLWETVTSVRTLRINAPASVHGPWLRKVPGGPDSPELRLLKALVPATGYFPDFLTPAPQRRSTSFEAGLAAIAATPPDLVAEELTRLHEHQPDDALPELVRDPVRALKLITRALDSYWRRAIEPDWRRIRALLQEDLAFRLDELGGGGVDRLFRNLHPSVRFSAGSLEVDRPYDCCTKPPLAGQGLLLVPCAFSWPTTLMVKGAPHVTTLTYPPRGLGRLWESRQETTESPLADLMGRSRAAILAHLDLPMSTTHLAHQLGVSAPTLSVHLGILRSSGLVTSHRDGRTVLYRRTPLGHHLLTASTPLASTA